ncbi:hypothetical protein PRUPE_6G196700 [Prunus persica]|uniref:Uncharacterized protein n=1 Tax=Prunus persica TaxID=3760 RepID=A0A251NUK2_PRUPE|nr:hypothetical protein PRUPE_6G196700 [Prunus persica]
MELRQLCRSERLPEQLSVFLRLYSSSTMTSVHFDNLKHHFHLCTSRHGDGLVIIYLFYCSLMSILIFAQVVRVYFILFYSKL